MVKKGKKTVPKPAPQDAPPQAAPPQAAPVAPTPLVPTSVESDNPGEKSKKGKQKSKTPETMPSLEQSMQAMDLSKISQKPTNQDRSRDSSSSTVISSTPPTEAGDAVPQGSKKSKKRGGKKTAASNDEPQTETQPQKPSLPQGIAHPQGFPQLHPQGRPQEFPQLASQPASVSQPPTVAPQQLAPPQTQSTQLQVPAQQPSSKTSAPQQKGGQQQTQQIVTPQTPRQSSPPSNQNALSIPVRGQGGKKEGRIITIETNYLALKISTKKHGFHYDVTIVPEKKIFFMDVMQKFISKIPGRYPAFDGMKNLYSFGPLPFPSGIHSDNIVLLDREKKPMTFEVTVKLATEFDFGSLLSYMKQGSSLTAPQQSIQCLDVVLRYAPLCNLIRVGRSFFSPPTGQVVSLGGGLDMWYGVFQSAVLGWKPFINVDISHKGFVKRQSAIDLCGELFGYDVTRESRPLRRDYLDNLRKFIKTLKIEYEIPGQASSMRTYRVNDVVETPGNYNFKLDNGKQTNITEYFAKERNYRIKYPHLPCLWVGSRSSEKKICVPLELCTLVPGQAYLKMMEGKQTSNMIRVSAAPADERKRKIMDTIKNMNYNKQNSLKEFDLGVGDNFEKVQGRVISPPILQYIQQEVRPRDGMWRGSEFRSTCPLVNWKVVSLCDRLDGRSVEQMIDLLKLNGKRAGMTISHPPVQNIRIQELQAVLKTAAAEKMQLVLTIIEEFGNHYSQVKQLAELNYGVLTQCVKKITVEKRMNDSTASQLLLKINSKLDNVNHILKSPVPCLRAPCMIMGADVTHPGPGNITDPSVAAVVASHCPRAFKYNIEVRLQQKEIIEDLKTMVKNQLLVFYKKSKAKPQHLIMFRDGVSEGQFLMVLNAELTAIRAACSDLSPEYKPKISYFVVQKRHHTRFFPTVKSDGDRNMNVPVGTCVDREITHPTEMNFFLLSHASIKGTARPTRYHCLWDDANMSETEVEELAFYLCHLYTRCNRSVSYPAPTYYAHLAAARAKVYTEGFKINLENLSSEQGRLKITEAILRDKPMFFV